MHKKYHDCQSSALCDKRIKFYFFVISKLRTLDSKGARPGPASFPGAMPSFTMKRQRDLVT